jgi:elongation factor G
MSVKGCRGTCRLRQMTLSLVQEQPKMKDYPPEKLRSVAVIGHGSTGKTSLCDSLLYRSGGADRLGSVDDGTSVFDYSAESRERKHSLCLSMGICEWSGHRVNLLDTPGLEDFHGNTIGGISASDGVILVLDGTDGVEVGSYKTWNFASDADVPVMIWVNRVDRENADFGRVLSEARDSLSMHVVPFVFPVVEGGSFKGLVNVLTGKAVDPSGREMPVPDSAKDSFDTYRAQLMEEAAETDEALMEAYFANDTLSPDELAAGIRTAVSRRDLFPLFCGTARPPSGQEFLLDAVTGFIPSPLERHPEHAEDGSEVNPDQSGPFVARAFNTNLDKHVGDLVYIRVLRGGIKGSEDVSNTDRNQTERLGNYYFVNGAERIDASRLVTGDVAAVAKLKQTVTNQTLSGKGKAVRLRPIAFPAPVYRTAIAPKKRGEEDKMGAGLSKLAAQDPTFVVKNETEIGQTTISGMGEQHINVMLERLKDLVGVEAETFKPRIAYHETISRTASGAYKHKKQSGGRGQYGHVFLRLEPLPRGEGFVFESEVVGGTVPTKFIPAVEKGVVEALSNGPISGSKVVDVKAVVYDGSSHSVDSSDMAFKLAASRCFKEVMMQAGPALLEPIMDLEITVPEEFMGDVMGDINSRRGRIQGMEADGTFQIIRAQVPEAELYQYTNALKSLTQARGSFRQQFAFYEPAPRDVQDRIASETSSEEEG